MLQTVLAIVIVVGCTVYATWSLLPAGGRRGIAKALLRQPLPGPAARFFRRHATETAGSGCGSCKRNPEATPKAGRPPAQGAPLVFHRPREGKD